MGTEAPDALEATAESLVTTAARLNRLNSKVLTKLPVPLTFRQYRTLVRVAAGRTSLTELAALSNLTLPSVSETVDGLVRRGLLTRTEHPDDRRAVVLALSPAGRSAGKAAKAALRDAVSGLLGGLSTEDHDALRRMLDVLYEAATEYFRVTEANEQASGARRGKR